MYEEDTALVAAMLAAMAARFTLLHHEGRDQRRKMSSGDATHTYYMFWLMPLASTSEFHLYCDI